MPSKADCIKAMTAAGVDAARAESLVDFVLKEKAGLKAQGQLTNLEGGLKTLRMLSPREFIRLTQTEPCPV